MLQYGLNQANRSKWGNVSLKIDRLYAITVYLLNHGKVSASELARKFEVSLRTIQRDMDALGHAGIPIAAQTGVSGGYYLTDTFHLDRQTATKEDYSLIHTALKGFSSAMKTPEIETTLENLSAVSKETEEGIILDFSVLREGNEKLLQTLQNAIRTKSPVQFTYTNADDITRSHTVEPIAVVYRWYAWYLLAYSIVKDDYRTYKLVRMRDVETVAVPFTKTHDAAEAIIRKNEQNKQQPCITVTVRCTPQARTKAIEYLNGKITQEYENGDCEMILSVIENENLWFGILLSLGDGIEILSPEHIRQRVQNAAKKIISLYDKL